MRIFDVLTMLGGLAMFLYGMHEMGNGLAKLSGGKLEQILESLTSKKIMAVLLGIVVTAVMQSSSATTVMVVGFVNSGIMQLSQVVGIIMGANVGTTVTSWLLSLTGLKETGGLLQFAKPSSFVPVIAVVGIIMIMMSKEGEKKYVTGNILIGFAILMSGMETMSGAVSPLAQNEKFTGILTIFSNPFMGILAGMILTAVIQSSSASVGILQALSVTSAINYEIAIPIIIGQNIGTCVTTLISSVGTNRNARRAAMIHLYFNIIGMVAFLILFYSVNAAAGGIKILEKPADAVGIAVVHSIFNMSSLLLLYPFSNRLVRLAIRTIPDKPDEDQKQTDEMSRLDIRFLEKPAFAMAQCRSASVFMAQTVQKTLFLALKNLNQYSKELVEEIFRMENNVDHYEDAIGTYLVKLNNCNLTQTDSHTLSILLHCIGDLERICDRALNITEAVQKMKEGGQDFSQKALEEMRIFSAALHDIVKQTIDAFELDDLEMAKRIEPFEQVIDSMSMELRQRHVKRLRKGKCTIDLGIVLEDIITNFERISDHCSNIAVCMIKVNEDEFGTHEYLDVIKAAKDPWFEQEYYRMTEKYKLPPVKKA